MRRLLPALLIAIALPAPAAAQGVTRCTDARGNTVFTDRSCASVNAVPKGVPAPAGGAYAPGFAPRGCARSADDLLQGVRTALEARDVNRLASFYHWPGTGSARAVMDALEEIAGRPLVAVELAYPTPPAPFNPLLAFGPNAAPEPDPALAADPEPPLPETQGVGPDAVTDGFADSVQAVDPAAALAAARPPSGPRPIGLDVQQMAGDDSAGSRSTRFQLHRNVGCWWLSL